MTLINPVFDVHKSILPAFWNGAKIQFKCHVIFIDHMITRSRDDKKILAGKGSVAVGMINHVVRNA